MEYVTESAMQHTVAQIHEQAGQRHAPFDPVAAAQKLGLQVFNSEFRNHGTSGVFKKGASGGYEIHVDRSSPRRRARFTVAHELGHFVLHKDEVEAVVDSDVNMYRRRSAGREEDPADRQREYQANMFAVEFLMPEEKVREAYRVTDDLTRLADVFDVSEEAMGYRVNDLRLGD